MIRTQKEWDIAYNEYLKSSEFKEGYSFEEEVSKVFGFNKEGIIVKYFIKTNKLRHLDLYNLFQEKLNIKLDTPLAFNTFAKEAEYPADIKAALVELFNIDFNVSDERVEKMALEIDGE